MNSNININDNVKIVGDGFVDIPRGEVGTVINIFRLPTGDVGVVKFAEKTAKVPLAVLEKVTSNQSEPVEPIGEIPEGAKLITRDEFSKAINDVISPDKETRAPMFALTGAIGCDMVVESIFKDGVGIVANKDDLTSLLWDECNPANFTDKELPSVQVSLAAIMYLMKIPEILFAESDNA